ncbi:MAG: hypothetical protein JW963_02310, partial [Anaerolineales bacterium]|nr:hypothetical protein [Anaerolineales bacterium]
MKRLMLLGLLGALFVIVRAECFTLEGHVVQGMDSLVTVEGSWVTMEYAPAPADNPLKGFMPFYDAYGSRNAPIANDFPHSMEWF